VLISNHVLSGALIGAVTRRPAAAFAIGVASHFVLDVVPHWGDWDSESHFLHVAVRDGLAGLAVMGAAAAVAPPEARLAVVAGMAGATLPDLDKPAVIYLGHSPFPRAVDKFHAAIQREARSRWWVEVAAGAALSTLAAVTVSRLRRPSRPLSTRPGSG
jgi:hypothetical protein